MAIWVRKMMPRYAKMQDRVLPGLGDGLGHGFFPVAWASHGKIVKLNSYRWEMFKHDDNRVVSHEQQASIMSYNMF